MPGYKLYSYTIYEPLGYDTSANSSSHSIISIPDCKFTSPVSNTSRSILDEFQNNNIQPTPYMAGLIDEYFFTLPTSSTHTGKTPRIFSKVLAGPRFEIPEIIEEKNNTSNNDFQHDNTNIQDFDNNFLTYDDRSDTYSATSDISATGSTNTIIGKKRRNSTCSTNNRKSPRIVINKSPRSYSGCYICRLRRIKCDEIKPMCTNCSFRGLACEFPQPNEPKPNYLINNNQRQLKLKEIKKAKRKTG